MASAGFNGTNRSSAPALPYRLFYALLGGALLLVLIAGGMLLRIRLGGLVGTPLNGSTAPAFQLTDQNGASVSLDQFLGEPVVLTFLYTNCPDVCPLIADKLRQTERLLGPDAGRVAVLAVSTDPRHDDRLAAQRFTTEHEMDNRWHFLIGSPEQLMPVWKAYYIGVSELATPGFAPDEAVPQGSVIHSDAIFLIDKAGKERVLLASDFRVADLAHDLRELLAG